MLNFLTRDQIFGLNDFADKLKVVSVPEWGGSVHVRPMSGAHRDRMEAQVNKDAGDNVMARIVAATACDDTGKLLFSDADASKLGEKSAHALKRVYDAAVEVNKLTPASIDELEKNSKAIPSDTTPSDSPSDSE